MAAYGALLSLAQTTELNGALQRCVLSTDCEKHIRTIHDYTIILLSFLEDFPEKARCWEGKIRDVAQEIEDIIDFFLWQKFQSRHEHIGPSSIELASQLENVKMKIGYIAVDIMDERPAAAAGSLPSRSASAASANNEVIGLDEDLFVIKNRLCGERETPHLQVIPIVGMGGIGKTTLARIAYDDPLIGYYFDIRVWLTVSQVYNPYEFKKTPKKLLEMQMNLLGMQIEECEMKTKVFQSLKGRRYLIVMDDIWSQEVWDDVRNMFPDDGNGSRIMLTTRLSDVATYPHSVSPVCQMQFLNYNQGCELLSQIVMKNRYFPLNLVDVGKKIARRCAGLPIAIVLVAGVLSTVNKTRASWEEIAKKIDLVVDGKLEEILSLSYMHLPHHLRPCFLFMGGFIEDAEIRASRLIQLWVAEGFLKHKKGCDFSLEEEAEETLEDLVKRNLVIVTKRKTNGKIKSCKLHDMTRELCIRKAFEEKFLHVMDGRPRPLGMINVRHINLSGNGIDNIYGPNIRTILYFQHSCIWNQPTFWGHFRLLRVLDAICENLKEIPSEVLLHMYHLRYLAIIGTLKIPSSISNLVNLQSLIIGPKFPNWQNTNVKSLLSLPLQIWQMPQLRHIVFINNPYTLPSPPVESTFPLVNLQTLLLVRDLVWDENILGMIPNVKKLGLLYTCHRYYNLHLLKHLHQLEKLEVRVAGHDEIWWKEQNSGFPSSLRKLTLVGGRFPFEDMAILGSLPNLEVLKLHDHATDGETWEIGDEEFPKLKLLSIDESSLRHWITGSRPLPRLNRLVLRGMRNLMEIPRAIGNLLTLEVIELDSVLGSLVESAMQIKELQQSYGNFDLQVQVLSIVEPAMLFKEVIHTAILKNFSRQKNVALASGTSNGNGQVVIGDTDCDWSGDRVPRRRRSNLRGAFLLQSVFCPNEKIPMPVPFATDDQL